jgi:hypothetical protein
LWSRDGGRGGVWCRTGDIPVWQCWFIVGFCGGTVNWLPGSAVMVSSWPMLRGDRSPKVATLQYYHTSKIDILLYNNNISNLDFPTEQWNICISTTCI